MTLLFDLRPGDFCWKVNRPLLGKPVRLSRWIRRPGSCVSWAAAERVSLQLDLLLLMMMRSEHHYHYQQQHVLSLCLGLFYAAIDGQEKDEGLTSMVFWAFHDTVTPLHSSVHPEIRSSTSRKFTDLSHGDLGKRVSEGGRGVMWQARCEGRQIDDDAYHRGCSSDWEYSIYACSGLAGTSIITCYYTKQESQSSKEDRYIKGYICISLRCDDKMTSSLECVWSQLKASKQQLAIWPNVTLHLPYNPANDPLAIHHEIASPSERR